jgi:diguanylate cyclase (GGDEF)-like protein
MNRDAGSDGKQVLADIVSSVLLPVAAGAAYIAWIYGLLVNDMPTVVMFPLSVAILIVLYFFSGHVYSGVALGFISVVGFLGVVLTPGGDRFVLLAETVWLWAIFYVLQRYRRSSEAIGNSLRERKEIRETQLTILKSEIEENEKRCVDLSQRIVNYQSLGRIVNTLVTAIEENEITSLIGELAARFVGKGTWSVRRSSQNDVFMQYVKRNHVPLIVQNLLNDTRFAFKRSRFSSVIAIPLEVNEKVQAILKGVAREPNAFDEDDLRRLSIMGGIASLSLHNAKLYQRTQELAITDGLTGLYVQKYFRERLGEEVLRSRNYHLPLSVVIMDIDHFKRINDTYGQTAGDVVLRQVAALLRRRLRETDFVSRYGGEEFGVIMMQTDGREARLVCEELKQCFENERLFLPVESFQPVYANVTVSMGIAVFDEGVTTAEQIPAGADKALYRAKRLGRNRVELADGRQA